MFLFWDVCFLCECLTCCVELDTIFFLFVTKSDFLRWQAALRAQWTACVICAMVSIGLWQKQTCSADAVKRGQEYFEHCSASSTSTLPSSTCTSPSSASLWVSYVFVGVWLLACPLLSHHHKGMQGSLELKYKGWMKFFCIFLPSCVSVETTCSTSASSYSRSAAVKATTSSSRTTLSSVNTILGFI